MATESQPPTSMRTPVAHALTIDVEDYFQVGVFQDRIRSEDWDVYEQRVERNLGRCLEILDERGLRATFFVLGWIAERHPALIRRLAEAGHEVGSHGYGHEPLWKLDPASFRKDLVRARETIGMATGSAPTSYRAPCFSVTRRTLWALPILAEEGVTDDSSIFPVGHPEYGIADAETRIHRIRLESGASLREFPMTVGSLLGRRLAFCGGGWFRLFPYALVRRGLRSAARDGHPFVFYLHPWELDPDQPRLRDKTGALGRFRHYVNLRHTEAKFLRLLEDFRFSSMGEVLDAHEAASEGLPERSYGV